MKSHQTWSTAFHKKNHKQVRHWLMNDKSVFRVFHIQTKQYWNLRRLHPYFHDLIKINRVIDGALYRQLKEAKLILAVYLQKPKTNSELLIYEWAEIWRNRYLLLVCVHSSNMWWNTSNNSLIFYKAEIRRKIAVFLWLYSAMKY